MTPEQSLHRTQSPKKLSLLYECYAQAKDQSGALVKDELPMRTFAPLMADITLFELTASNQLVYRVAGQNVLDRMNIPLRGRDMLDFVQPDFRARVLYAHKLALSHPCGYFMVFGARYPTGGVRRLETIRLPMRDTKGSPLTGFLGLNLHGEIVRYDTPEATPKTFIAGKGEFSSFVDLGHGLPVLADDCSEETRLLHAQAVFDHSDRHANPTDHAID
ncbi:MAG: hypothetical protein RLN89_04875 [Parvibaculum sp.]